MILFSNHELLKNGLIIFFKLKFYFWTELPHFIKYFQAHLNQNFNVEVQHWEPASPVGSRRSIDLVLDEMVPAVGASAGEANRSR